MGTLKIPAITKITIIIKIAKIDTFPFTSTIAAKIAESTKISKIAKIARIV